MKRGKDKDKRDKENRAKKNKTTHATPDDKVYDKWKI